MTGHSHLSTTMNCRSTMAPLLAAHGPVSKEDTGTWSRSQITMFKNDNHGFFSPGRATSPGRCTAGPPGQPGGGGKVFTKVLAREKHLRPFRWYFGFSLKRRPLHPSLGNSFLNTPMNRVGWLDGHRFGVNDWHHCLARLYRHPDHDRQCFFDLATSTRTLCGGRCF